MQCPVDNETLVMTERSGVEIDYCPKCRGVWLDRGELDKIIERSAPPPQQVPRQEAHRQESYGHDKKPYRKKKESFLSDLFDF
ncbi:zf-TFIIB domain-containing protein [Roseibium sp. DSM 29163]|uniref:Zf-TFIIB domain-containing protein n=2 Tax=Roseibium salinum TaxID=1604349 RepID=A0ABT3R7I9_9HYPH|nr:zf-TFIIB domain-containing protein [Roseibium sp. DSM 29163]MCX2724958.1 zf-TFIIB domain-containing protein [Roseibium sp. DSM 29163]